MERNEYLVWCLEDNAFYYTDNELIKYLSNAYCGIFEVDVFLIGDQWCSYIGEI